MVEQVHFVVHEAIIEELYMDQTNSTNFAINFEVIGMGEYSALMVMVPQWYCIHLYIHPYTTTSVSSVQL